MIPAGFAYARPTSQDEALAVLVEHGDDAKILAGGMSLLPLMKLRLVNPAVLVDVGGLGDLAHVTDMGSEIAIGALTRHRDLQTNGLLARECPVLPGVAAQVGDPQVRHRGTIGGSVAHGDPASDLAAVLVALDATFVARGPGGSREIGAGEFFVGFLETALGPDELLVEIRVPKTGSVPFSYQKLNRRAIDWAIVGAVALVGPKGDDGDSRRVALVNMGATPIRARGVEAGVAAGASILDAAERAGDGTDPPSDANASAQYRMHLARVLVRRALTEVQALR